MANEQLQNEITERKRTEAALLESEERYRTLFETSPDTVILIDMDNKILFANRQAASVHGYRSAKMLTGMDVDALIAPEDRELVRQNIGDALKMGSKREIEYQVLMKDGSRYPAELNVSVVRDELNHPKGLLMDIRDITERKWAEEALRLAYAYNRSLIEASIDPLVTITPDGKIGDVNRATEVVTGYTRNELIGTEFDSYFTNPERARSGYQQAFEAGDVRGHELEIRHKDGHITPVLYNASVYRDENGTVMGVFAVARDITDRKQFETQLIQAERHAIIGRMVGSITHEINNPLQTIKNCLYLIQQDVTKESPIKEPLGMATSETMRLTNLVSHLRALYRPRVSLGKEPHEILDIIEEVHSLLIPHLNNAKVIWQSLPGLQRCIINCVRDQIVEVFLNISMNAIEAMQGTGGTLFVDMNVSVDQVAVIFRDTGPGIPDEIAHNLFEPFMTTKGSGLGLGLSISYGIVQRHGGQIKVETKPDQGATFTISLPMYMRGIGQEEIDHGNE
jgi:PAS domain S-box-containing protein